MNLGQMLFNGKCKVFAPFYYIPMEIGIKYFLLDDISICMQQRRRNIAGRDIASCH